MLLQELTQLLEAKPKVVKYLTAQEALKQYEGPVREFLSGWRDEDNSLNSKSDQELLKRMYKDGSEFVIIKVGKSEELATWDKVNLDSMLVWSDDEEAWDPLDGY